MSVARQPEGDFLHSCAGVLPKCLGSYIYGQKGEASLPVDVPLLKVAP